MKGAALSALLSAVFATGCSSGDAAQSPGGKAGSGTGGDATGGASGSGASGGAGGSGAGGSGTGGSGAGGSGTGGSGAGGSGTGGSNTGGNGAGGSGTGGSGGASGSTGSGGTGGGPCEDTCAVGNGIDWRCEKRFMYGMNYAWRNFAADFGGIRQWNAVGVAGDAAGFTAELADMRAHGASVIRWWVFPDFRTDGVAFDTSETPTGLGGTAVADLTRALELAEQTNLYLMLTLFSFDNFRPSRTEAEVPIPGLAPIARDATKRTALMERVVRPFARAAAASPFAHRLISWDVINEPEWAMTGPSPYGDDSYAPTRGLDPLTHAQMETFVRDVIGVLREETDALITVGGAAAKWAKAWSRVDVDFYQLHMYPWINDYWPYTRSPRELGISDKPVVMGEFPMGDLDSGSISRGAPHASVVSSWWSNGYAGALSWQYADRPAGGLDNVKAFADAHSCETSYGSSAALLQAIAKPAVSDQARGVRIPSVRGCRVVNGRPDCT